MKTELTAERLRELLHYDPETGVFTNRVSRRRVLAGVIAGGLDAYGYVKISIDMHRYLAHRLAWFYVYGEWPHSGVDHVNGVRSDNRIKNLRMANQSQNLQNRSIFTTNKSGMLGVSWDSSRSRWMAAIKSDGKMKYLGRFKSIEDASSAYLDAKLKLHKFQPAPRLS